MEPKKMIELTVGIVVGLVVFSAILMPVMNNATATEHTFTNEGYARYASIESTSDEVITVIWDHTKPLIINVNGEDVDYTVNASSTSIVFGDNWSVRLNDAGTSAGMQYIGNSNQDYLLTSTANEMDMTITLSAGTATLTDGTTTKTNSYNTAFYPNKDGTMVMKKSDESAHLLKDSSIIAANGMTNVHGSAIGIRFDGTIQDGYEFNLYRNVASASVSNVESHYVEDVRYLDLVELSNITFNLDVEDETTTPATYSYFLIPYQVTAELAVHADQDTIEMLKVIPILIIAGLIVGIAATVVSRRE